MFKTEHFLTHPMKPALPWNQSQPETLQENYRPISFKNISVKVSPKNQKGKFISILKRFYTVTNYDLFLWCKDVSVYKN